MSDYFHDVPGRLRIRIEAIRDNPSTGIQIQEILTRTSGIKRVSVRSTTGSVIINYDPRSLDSRDILKVLAENAYIDLPKFTALNPQLETAIHRVVEVIIKAVLSQAVSNALKGSSVSIVTTLL
jgi:hypothetical protein